MNRSIAFAALALTVAPAWAADCTVGRLAELPVTMYRTRPVVTGTINGVEARFLVDSGAFFSMMSRDTVNKNQLKLFPLPSNMRVRGVGGAATDAQVTKVKQLTLVGFPGPVANVDFIVGGNSTVFSGIDGLIGQNLIGTNDTEFDLANGHLRLMRSKDCGERSLAYWAGDKPVGVVRIDERTLLEPHLIGRATINGVQIRVMFDSGASRSVLSKKAAERAGMTMDHENMDAAGLSAGIGNRMVETSIARFDVFDIGGEQIKNARLLVGDLGPREMLLGADFFLSHRIYVATKQNKIYFTYNGGRVFDLGQRSTEATTAATQALDAEGYRRRGSASAGRGDHAAAIADFDRAIELEPNNAETFYQRGMSKRDSRQGLQAMTDFNEALRLKPDHSSALMARGQMQLAINAVARADADFDALEAQSPNDPALALNIARTYAATRHYDEAIARFDRWLTKYPKDDRGASVYGERCYMRALASKDLELARADCDTAIKRGGRNSRVLDARGLVWLQLGNAKEASNDFSAALKLQPRGEVSLYGLGLAEIKLGRKEQGEQRVREAAEIDATVVQRFERMKLVP
jgi:tetratricopeptide (TPR) repeat protein